MINANCFTRCRNAIAERNHRIVSFIQDILADIRAQNETLKAFEHLDTLSESQRASLPLAGIPFAAKRHYRCRGYAHKIWLHCTNRIYG